MSGTDHDLVAPYKERKRTATDAAQSWWSLVSGSNIQNKYLTMVKTDVFNNNFQRAGWRSCVSPVLNEAVGN